MTKRRTRRESGRRVKHSRLKRAIWQFLTDEGEHNTFDIADHLKDVGQSFSRHQLTQVLNKNPMFVKIAKENIKRPVIGPGAADPTTYGVGGGTPTRLVNIYRAATIEEMAERIMKYDNPISGYDQLPNFLANKIRNFISSQGETKIEGE